MTARPDSDSNHHTDLTLTVDFTGSECILTLALLYDGDRGREASYVWTLLTNRLMFTAIHTERPATAWETRFLRGRKHEKGSHSF